MSLRKDGMKAGMADKKIRGQALTALGIGLLGLTVYAAGCSLPSRTYVNDTGGGTSNGGDSTTGGDAGNSTTGGSSTMGGSATSGGSSGSSSAGTGGGGGQPGMNRPVPTKGLIVIGGTLIDPTKGGIISVIQPITGTELLRETLTAPSQVAGIAYDGAAKKDVWYVFISTAFPAQPDKSVSLETRYFDDTNNTWVTLKTLNPIPPPVPGTLTVLNDRLAYLSYVNQNNKTVPSLTVLDTSDVLAIKQVTYSPDTTQGSFVSLIGTRGTAADPTGVGGTLDLGLSQNCSTATSPVCELHVLPIAVGDTIQDGVSHLIGSYQGTPLAAAAQLQQKDFFVLSDASSKVVLYTANDPTSPEGASMFPAPQAVADLAGMTLAECQNLGIFTAASENALYGLTLGFGAGNTLDLGRPGQIVAYEPFSKDVISTYNPPTGSLPKPEITALPVTSTGDLDVGLKVRTTGWKPPVDVRTNTLTTRFPVPFKCK
jgi:hypothetical protein